MTITLTLNEEQEEKLNCILASQEEELSTQELIQALFNETLTANYIYHSKCGDYETIQRQFPEEDEEATTAYYDSEEGNELLLYDPLDPCVETDEEGHRI